MAIFQLIKNTFHAGYFPSRQRMTGMQCRVPSQPAPNREATLVSVHYLAGRLGVNARTVWRLISGEKNFPRPVKIGGSTRFVLSEINAYIEGV